jgi:tRNA-specific 2-thiouridylase
VAALLEARRGAEVVAITVKLWADRRTDGTRACCSPEAVLGARRLAHSMGLPHLTLDLRERFRHAVVDPFVAGYDHGETPNPCVLCNGSVRIEAMLRVARALGARALATGHYACLADDGEGPLLGAAADPAKDQTYMLAALRPHLLADLHFPLAGLRKPEVRALAAEAGLSVADRAESQDLCFLAGEGKRSFLARHSERNDEEGDLVGPDGVILGRHPGYRGFTVGQRRGIGLGAAEPLYVLGTDAGSNRVVVGPRARLATRRVRVRGAVLHREPGRVDRVRLRHHSQPIACRVEGEEAAGRRWLRLEEPAYGVAPGQTACLMDGALVVGHATIDAQPALRP